MNKDTGIVVTLVFLMNRLVEILVRFRLDHVVMGAVFFVPFWLLISPVTGWVAVSMYYLGRERRDQEMHLTHYPDVWPFDPHKDWWKYWSVWRWGKEQQFDLFLPVIFYGVLAWIL